MKIMILLTIYFAQYLLCVFLTELCLRCWERTEHKASSLRRYWLSLFTLLCLLPVAGAFLPVAPLKYILQGAGNIWLGFYLYYGGALLVLLTVCGFVSLLLKKKPERRWFGGILCLSLALATVLFCYGMFHAQQTRVISYEIDVAKQTKEIPSMRIVLVGDLHLGVNSGLAMTEHMVALINEAEPDVVVVAGDVFTSTYKGLAHPERYTAVLRKIKARYGVYAVYGNHDVEETLFGGYAISPVSQAFRGKEMERFFREAGFMTLEDEVVMLPGGVQLAGRIDGRKAGDGTKHRKSASALLAKTDRDHPVLVAEHEPMEYRELAEAGADVILSGHTHDGQLFPGNLIVRHWNENAWGHKKLHGVDTFVTAGVGYYGPPMRVGTDSEVTVIDLEFR